MFNLNTSPWVVKNGVGVDSGVVDFDVSSSLKNEKTDRLTRFHEP